MSIKEILETKTPIKAWCWQKMSPLHETDLKSFAPDNYDYPKNTCIKANLNLVKMFKKNRWYSLDEIIEILERSGIGRDRSKELAKELINTGDFIVKDSSFFFSPKYAAFVKSSTSNKPMYKLIIRSIEPSDFLF